MHCSRVCGAAGRAKPLATCRRCAARFKPKRKAPGHYCSRTCQHAARRGRRIGGRPSIGPPTPLRNLVYFRRCRACDHPFVARNRTRELCSPECRARDARSQNAMKKAVVCLECPECGTVFAPEYGDKARKFCSTRCGTKNNARAAKARRDERVVANGYEAFDPIEVLARDGWRCRLCKVETPRPLRGTFEPNAPELDHIVPIARGGAHTRDNTQCACRRCNIAKGDTVSGLTLWLGFAAANRERLAGRRGLVDRLP
jgi:hypothetical protein